MNIVLVMLDTLRRDHVGCYGNKWIKTPNMDQLAKESMVFDRAVEESLPTLPVRRALHTGMRTFPFTKRFFSAETQAIAAQSTGGAAGTCSRLGADTLGPTDNCGACGQQRLSHQHDL